MLENTIRDRCHVNTNRDTDTFVGIECNADNISINFPLGFHLDDEDNALRNDIRLLLKVLGSFTQKRESAVLAESLKFEGVNIPIQAYLFLISDFYINGIYKERESKYQLAKQGKISWNRTIKTQKPYIQDNKCYYLNFITHKNLINENELISQIHEYCIYESFRKIGWLFTSTIPSKPSIKYNQRLFSSVVQKKYYNTFNDRNKRLFLNMMAVINSAGDPDAPTKYKYGTNKFQFVWQNMIDQVYGIRNKEDYYPRTKWMLPKIQYLNSPLEPDTIMLCNGNIYVLDAKYYKFGTTKQACDLPGSADINKQVTYGENIANQEVFKKIHGENYILYNAFIMPFDSNDPSWNTNDTVLHIGESICSWKKNNKTYEHIHGILLDVKNLMKITTAQNQNEIAKLAKFIENSINANKFVN